MRILIDGVVWGEKQANGEYSTEEQSFQFEKVIPGEPLPAILRMTAAGGNEVDFDLQELYDMVCLFVRSPF